MKNTPVSDTSKKEGQKIENEKNGPANKKTLENDILLSEKDEVKEAERRMSKNAKGK